MTIMIYNKYDVLVTQYESNAVPNVGDKVCIFLGGIDDRYCNGKVTDRLFGKDYVVVTTDSEDKPLSKFEKEASGDRWMYEEDWSF